jgi:hypothetical protein
MASISNFISRVKNDGFSRENRFEVVITPPFSLGATTEEKEKLLFYCQAVSMPGINFMTQEVYTFGEAREVIYNRNYDPIQLEFLMDEQMSVKWFFDRWTEQIVDPRTRMMSYYNDYVSTVDLSQIDASDTEKVKYTIRLHEAYPKTIDAIQYSADSKNLVKLRVTLQYKYWTVTEGPQVNKQTDRDVPNLGRIQTPS